jgi:hypothetical protein
MDMHRVATDGILERLQDAALGELRGAMRQARSDLNALYTALVSDALRDESNPARHATTHARVIRIADALWQEQAASVRAEARVQLRDELRAAAAIPWLTSQERKDLQGTSTADVENIMTQRITSEPDVVCQAAVMLHGAVAEKTQGPLRAFIFKVLRARGTIADFNKALLAEPDATFSDSAMQTAHAALMHAMATHVYVPAEYARRVLKHLGLETLSGLWMRMRVLEEAQRRRRGAATREHILAQILSGSADVQHFATHLRDAALADLARRGEDVADECAVELAKLARQDEVAALAGGRRTPRTMSPSKSRSGSGLGSRPRPRSRSKSRSKSRSRSHRQVD